MSSPGTNPPSVNGISTNKLIISIIVGVILIALVGRAIWAYYEVRNDEAKVALQESSPIIVNTAVNQLPVEQPLTTTKTAVVNDISTQNGITMSVKINAPVTTTASCGTAGCFQQKFFTCQPATLDADAGFASVHYRIINPLDSQHCRMSFMYTKSPNPDWTNKEMTCTYLNKVSYGDNPNSYEVQVGNMFNSVLSTGGDASDACGGPLYDTLQPNKTFSSVNQSATPTASFSLLTDTLAEVSSVTVKVGEWANYSWHSKNADNFSVIEDRSGCSDSSSNIIGQTNVTTADGSRSSKITSRLAGCTIKSTYVAKNIQTGKQATSIVTVIVK